MTATSYPLGHKLKSDAAQVLQKALDMDVVLSVVNGKLRAAGNSESVQELVPLLRQYRAELLALLNVQHGHPTQADAAKVAAVVEKAGRFKMRVDRFVRIGLSGGDAEELAQRLAWRDQDFDRRTACAECQHLHGRPGAWRCGNWQRADVGGPAIPSVFVAQMLQHCPGFKEGIK